ncbi:MAG: hypothetical protein ABL876_03955, partial [Chitinophagaceae bacterium]
YSLWYQFDSHPEKTVHGRTGVSGIRFFLWEGQLSRIADTGMLKEKKDHIFYLHTLLWAFLPWSIVLFTAIIDKIRTGVKKQGMLQQEWFTLTGSLLAILLFSLARFQLPYYTNVIFPFLAVITAAYIYKIRETSSRFFSILQSGFTIIILAVPVLLQVFYSPAVSSYLVFIVWAALLALLIVLPRLVKLNKTLIAFCRAGLAILILNFYLNQLFYPDLLKYQSGTEAAFIANKNYPGKPGVYVSLYSPAFEFYLEKEALHGGSDPVPDTGAVLSGTWYINEEELGHLKTNGTKYELIKELPHFSVTQLSLKFINKKTRDKELKKRYLVRMQ